MDAFLPPPSHSCLERSRTALTKTSPALSSSHLPASSVVIVGISEICSTSPNILEWNLYRFTKNFLVIRRSDVQFDWNYGQVSGQSVFARSTAFNRYPWVCSAGSHYWKYVGMDILPNLPQVVKWVGEAGAHPSHPIICPPTNPSLWHLPILVSPLHFCLFLFNSFSDWIVPCACLDLTSPMSIALFHLKKNIWALLPWLSTDQKCFHTWATERKPNFSIGTDPQLQNAPSQVDHFRGVKGRSGVDEINMAANKDPGRVCPFLFDFHHFLGRERGRERGRATYSIYIQKTKQGGRSFMALVTCTVHVLNTQC